MAGSYVKKEFGLGPEEQTLLKDSNGTRIVPSKGAEPVRLSPGWEGTNRPDDELNFKGITMDQADLELNPPRDRLNIVLFIMILHGIGALTPWNMFITANDYFSEYKLSESYIGYNSTLPGYYLSTVTMTAQIPNFIFSWLNIFLPLGGKLTTRIVWGILIQVSVFVFTVILAMVDTSTCPDLFFWVTMASVLILNVSGGIYQNSVFGMAAKLPGKYTGAVVLGSNISGTFTTVVKFFSLYFATNPRTSAIYYFITALFVLLACFDTYFALPINRFYRYHEYMNEKEAKKKIEFNSGKEVKTPLWTVFKQCALQCFNVWFVFFVTLSIFPGVQSSIQRSPDFIVPEKYYSVLMCFMTFNVVAMIGSYVATLFQWPSKKYVIVPILLRAVFIPLFLICNYLPAGVTHRDYILIQNDWIYFGIAVAMAFTSGYFSSVVMMYCSTTVEPQYSSTAGMFGAAFLVTGIFSGCLFAWAMPPIAKYFG